MGWDKSCPVCRCDGRNYENIETYGEIAILFASYFKRRIKIDNYSNYLGSHGGFIDRCDAIIFNIHLFFWLSLINKN